MKSLNTNIGIVKLFVESLIAYIVIVKSIGGFIDRSYRYSQVVCGIAYIGTVKSFGGIINRSYRYSQVVSVESLIAYIDKVKDGIIYPSNRYSQVVSRSHLSLK